MPEFHVTVAKVQKVDDHPDQGYQHLSLVTVCDKICIAGKTDNHYHRYDAGWLVLFFPINSIIPLDLLKRQGYYWDAEKDRGLLKGKKRNRVGPVPRGTITSEGLLFPVEGGYSNPHYIFNASGNELIVQEGDYVEDFLGVTEYVP